MKKQIIRQGDVYIILNAGKLPGGLLPREDRVLATGESTGHQHTLTCGTVYGELDGTQWVVIDEPAELVHQEHDTLTIPVGVHEVRIQREYVPWSVPRKVID